MKRRTDVLRQDAAAPEASPDVVCAGDDLFSVRHHVCSVATSLPQFPTVYACTTEMKDHTGLLAKSMLPTTLGHLSEKTSSSDAGAWACIASFPSAWTGQRKDE